MVDCEIKDSINFLKILEGDKVYYGGDQKWFEDGNLRKFGCSIVAASNILAYTAKKIGNRKLYDYTDLSRENFSNYMSKVSEYLYPDERLGVISSLYFIEKVKEFALNRGVKMQAYYITSEYNFDKIEDFIREGLNKDNPIALLMFKNRKLKEFDWHWMTITKIMEFFNREYLNISSWGERHVISLDDFYIFSHYGTLTYFDVVN